MKRPATGAHVRPGHFRQNRKVTTLHTLSRSSAFLRSLPRVEESGPAPAYLPAPVEAPQRLLLRRQRHPVLLQQRQLHLQQTHMVGQPVEAPAVVGVRVLQSRQSTISGHASPNISWSSSSGSSVARSGYSRRIEGFVGGFLSRPDEPASASAEPSWDGPAPA